MFQLSLDVWMLIKNTLMLCFVDGNSIYLKSLLGYIFGLNKYASLVNEMFQLPHDVWMLTKLHSCSFFVDGKSNSQNEEESFSHSQQAWKLSCILYWKYVIGYMYVNLVHCLLIKTPCVVLCFRLVFSVL